MVPVFGVDCDLSRGAKRDLIIAHVVGNIDYSHRTTSSRPRFRFNERQRTYQLSCRDCIHDRAHLGLEYSPRHGVKSNLCIIARHHPLHGILIERRPQLLIASWLY